ncbi:MAG: hypothetical protein PHW46_02325 [Candidatus Omnitrophica bacterium]|nr:hypothetical protein [Candidatus Omnitrophota bacterium]
MRTVVSLTIILMLAITQIAIKDGICETVGSSLSASSDTKFVSRLTKKQELLTCMSESISDFQKACSRTIHKQETQKTEDLDMTLSGLSVAEYKLAALANDSINSTETTKFNVYRPVNMGNLMPKSCFKNEESKQSKT